MFTGGNSILKYINNMKGEEGAPLIQTTTQYDIFTDGSEIKEKGTYKTLGLGWAYVVKQNKETIAEVSGTMSEGNNQRVELYAIYKALEYLQKISLNSTIKYL